MGVLVTPRPSLTGRAGSPDRHSTMVAACAHSDLMHSAHRACGCVCLTTESPTSEEMFVGQVELVFDGGLSLDQKRAFFDDVSLGNWPSQDLMAACRTS